MKTTTQLFILLIGLLVFTSSRGFSQSTNIEKALAEIIKEKIHVRSSKVPKHETPANHLINMRSADEIKITRNNQLDISEGEPMIAVDENDPNYMSLSFMRSSDIGLEMPIYYSIDAGKSWSLSEFKISNVINTQTETAGSTLLGGGDPVLLYDNNHKLYYSWISFTVGTSGIKIITWYATSNNQGKTFEINRQQPYIALGKLESLQSSNIENYGNGILDRQWLAIDRSNGPRRGTIYCSGLHLPRPDANKFMGISITKLTPSSNKFNEKISIVNDDPDLQFANIDVDNIGNLHIVYASTNNRGIFHQVSKDGGVSFSNVHKIDDSKYSMQGTRIIQLRENPMPMIAIDNSNNQLFVSWTNYEKQNVQAFYSSSINNGTQWSAPTPIGEFRGNNYQSFMPALSTNEKGDLSFSWFQMDEKGQSRFYTSVKEKNDFVAHDPIKITSKTTNFLPYINRQDVFFGDYLNSVMIGCKTFAVFSDGRENRGAKLYLGVTDYCEEISKVYNISSNSKTFDVKAVYPQPAKEIITMSINSKIEQNISLDWFNTLGQLIAEEKTIVLKTGENKIIVEIPNTLIGRQIINIRLRTGSYSYVQKIVVQ